MQRSLSSLGWKPLFNQQLSVEALSDGVLMRVVAVHRGRLISWSESGEHDIELARAPNLMALTVGDWFVQMPDDSYLPLESFSRFARKSPHGQYLQSIAANIDTAFLVTSCNDDFNLSRLERYMAMAMEAQVEVVVVLTKADTVDESRIEQLNETLRELKLLHSPCFVNALDKNSCEPLIDWCSEGQTVVLLGSSGVGKTTLTNTLCDLTLATQDIREDDSKGRHTTTHRALHPMPSGALLLDSPGMRELQLSACEEGLTETFHDIAELAQRCRFKDCAHNSEPGCAVREAMEAGTLSPRRLENYRKLLREQERNQQTLAEAHAKDRKLGKFYKTVQSASRQQRGKA